MEHSLGDLGCRDPDGQSSLGGLVSMLWVPCRRCLFYPASFLPFISRADYGMTVTEQLACPLWLVWLQRRGALCKGQASAFALTLL
jgi:hypothetical protein